MSEIKDNSVDIELPKKKIRLKYGTNWIIILVLSFWTLFTALAICFLILEGSYAGIKRLWNDWRVSQNYEIIPNSYARYQCWNDVGDVGKIINCGVTFNLGQRNQQKLNSRREHKPYSWFRFLTPDNLSLSGNSPMIRSVGDPTKVTFLFGVETLKIRFLTFLGQKLFWGIILSVFLWGLYIWWRVLYWRSVPNDVRLKVVKIVGYHDRWLGRVYSYYGLTKAEVLEALKINPTPNTWVFTKPLRTQLSNNPIRKKQKPIFLSKDQKFGLAIEAKQAGGGFFLDHNLTRLVLSKQDKAKLQASINAYQAWIAQHPEVLQKFDAYIENMPETEQDKIYNPLKE
ncbi:hypothetical protein N5853_02265 [Bartonella sp. HY329]|uniref:hypothetical protein n=1 Tax=unclassified Bartonella TaxID=2645622 RepID=UPI0021C6C4B4|nr:MULTISPECIES: hypothetical protein [unclassified Bartonella]UXM95483.1 hypothetical protein N5853_02265 [Bartonella sp. HY329]UXN09809.1 hypothetical protein N5852_02275 [Bartonella sp. HY328]